LVISNHNNFLVLFDKIASVFLFEKYIYSLALEMANPGNQHCTNCIGALSFRRSLRNQRRYLTARSVYHLGGPSPTMHRALAEFWLIKVCEHWQCNNVMLYNIYNNHLLQWIHLLKEFSKQNNSHQQEAQLSPRDRATHHVSWNRAKCRTIFVELHMINLATRSLEMAQIDRPYDTSY